jgi:uncharacterized protein (TIGR02271 family)
MESTDQQYAYHEGMTVYGADGEKVGKVVAVDPAYVVVEKGFFFPTDYYVPTSAIASATEDELYLTVSKDEALNQAWDQPPPATEGFAAAGYPADATTVAREAGAAATGYDRTTADVEDRDRIRVPVHEEELRAVTRERERGAVRVEKDVVAEERALDVPVTEERVRVRQVAADRDATADPTAFEEGVIEVPVRGEEVELEKRARVAGEVEVEKERVGRTERVAGTVRKERVRVDDQNVEPIGGAGEATS